MSETRTGAELFVDALLEYGVTRVFGNPGTTELPVVRAVAESDLEYVLALHEDVAVGAAAGYASTRRYHAHDLGLGAPSRSTGAGAAGDGADADTAAGSATAETDSDPGSDRDPEPVNPLGVANLHVAPGLAHGLGNLYGASVAGAPVLVTAGNHSRDFRHEEPILSGDVVRMADQFCKWSAEVLDVAAVPTMVRRAVRTALTPPTGPVFLALPLDVMTDETDAGPERLGRIPTAGRGDAAMLAAATDALVAADNPVLVVGDGVARADAVEEAVAFAEATGARVHGEILACEVNFPADHDQWASYVPPDEGLASTLFSTDLLVFAGCSTNTTLTRHESPLVPDTATCLHVSDDAWQVGKNQPADVGIVGDPGDVLAELAWRVGDRLDADARDARLERAASMTAFVAAKVAEMGEGAGGDDPRASKADLVDAIRAAAPDAYVVDEGVTAKYAMLTRWPLDARQYLSNKGGGLGYGLPAALGAAIAEAETDDPRSVLGFVGDGSYLYYPHALYTAARYGLDLTVVIPDNRNYRILKENAVELFEDLDLADFEAIDGEGGKGTDDGDGTDEGGSDDANRVTVGEDAAGPLAGVDFSPPVDIPANAESHGARGRLVEDPDAIEGAVREALARPGPDVLDVLVHD